MSKEKKLVANLIETPDGTILWSRFSHDYVEYTDANGETYMLDGGNEYIRTVVNKEKAKSLAVYNTDKWDLQRQYILRGTFDKNDMRIFVPLCKLSDKHLENIIIDNEEYGRSSKVYKREQNYRKKHNLTVEEHDYSNEKIESIIKK